LSLNHHKKIK